MRTLRLAVLLWVAPVLAGAQAEKRPNVLWICADDHAAYVTACYGNKIVRTPNIDRLAAGGVRFDRAYCASPVCTASRQAFLTGRYPRSIGVTQLSTPLPESELTLAEMLRDAGYETAAIGKMHFNSDLRHGFNVRADSPEHRKWLAAKPRAAVPNGVEVLGPWKPFKDPAHVWLNARALPRAMDADMDATYFAGRAAEFLSGARERPFFLMVSFTQPHSPFNFPVEFAGKYQARQFSAPAVDPSDDSRIPEVFRDLTDEQKRGIAAAYYTAIEYVDSKVGQVLDALERSGQADNTLVIYTGDHGYMLGQHGRFEKHCGYEPAIRAPLIIRPPGAARAGGASPALVNLIDVVPTVLDAAGVRVPANVQGRSLTTVLREPATHHRDGVFVEYSENEEAYLVTERWKFIYGTGKRLRQDGYETGSPPPGRTVMLFDLKGDPEERINLAGRPEHAERVAGFTSQLADHMKATARQPELVPQTDDPHAILEHCLQPRDVEARPR